MTMVNNFVVRLFVELYNCPSLTKGISFVLSSSCNLDQKHISRKGRLTLSVRMPTLQAIFTFVFLSTPMLSWSTTAGEKLQAMKAGVTLPSPLIWSTAVFDDEDSVYIFGGYTFYT
jgi:hypothetical protein